MNAARLILSVVLFLSVAATEGLTAGVIVADSTSRAPLPNASIYDRQGRAIAVSDIRGHLPEISTESYPLTLRYIGFLDKTIHSPAAGDTIFMQENIAELPEFTVESSRHKLLHILAYVREYSSLATNTDTVFLFREKMVDFMLPADKKVKFEGWSLPRVLSAKSYVRFTDDEGLDSVSDASRNHFSWADWMGPVPEANLPEKLIAAEHGTDTVRGKYSATEIWNKDGDRLHLHVDVMADTMSRKWVPSLALFFRRDTDFERFTIDFNFDNITDWKLSPLELTDYSFHVESTGRGRDMFMFNHVDQSFYVTTDAEVYIIDKEYVTVKEARQWDRHKFDPSQTVLYVPAEAPPLPSDIENLMLRVDNIDKGGVRLGVVPDHRLVAKYDSRKNFRLGYRALAILKQLTGISAYKSNRSTGSNWSKFKKDWKNRKRKEPKH